MPKKIDTIKLPKKRPRGTPVPAEKIIPNPRREEERRKCREPIKPEELEREKGA